MSRFARHDSAALARTRKGCLASLDMTVQCSSFYGLTAPLVISRAARNLPIQHYNTPPLPFRAQREIYQSSRAQRAILPFARSETSTNPALQYTPFVISSGARNLPIQSRAASNLAIRAEREIYQSSPTTHPLVISSAARNLTIQRAPLTTTRLTMSRFARHDSAALVKTRKGCLASLARTVQHSPGHGKDVSLRST
jgi:hypothetical protein